MTTILKTYVESGKQSTRALFQPTAIYPLVALRIAFGMAMAMWSLSMLVSGMVSKLFIDPHFFFSYRGLDWIRPLSSFGMHAIFVIIFLSSILITIGWFFRISAIVFITCFAYVVLIDRANYLTYFYYVLLISIMLMLSPAHRLFSIDLIRKPSLRVDYVPRWIILAFQIQIAMVFFFAGMAKLNADWLFSGRPVAIWLSDIAARYGFADTWISNSGIVALAFSWFLVLFDFIVPHFLLDQRSSIKAFQLVVFVQLFGVLLLPTGFFPVLLIFSCIVFLPIDLLHAAISRMSYFLYDIFQFKGDVFKVGGSYLLQFRDKKIFPLFIFCFLAVQILLPVALFLKWGSAEWSDKAFAFSWKIGLQEKRGEIKFWAVDSITGEEYLLNLNKYLTSYQQERMIDNRELILQFAKHLQQQPKITASSNPVNLRAQASISFNGRKPVCIVDKNQDLFMQLATGSGRK
jgi:hypothetical protein